MNNIIHINIEKDFRKLVNQDHLKITAKIVLRHLSENDFEFTLSIVGEKKIRELNKKFRSIDSETDVLSFYANETNPETGKKYVGDVIISYPVAEIQSKALHNRISDELDLLLIHGMLHLLGFDHGSEEEEKQMFAIQSKLAQLIRDQLEYFK